MGRLPNNQTVRPPSGGLSYTPQNSIALPMEAQCENTVLFSCLFSEISTRRVLFSYPPPRGESGPLPSG